MRRRWCLLHSEYLLNYQTTMNVLIAKLGATGDVVRTTALLHRFNDHVSWITEAKNTILLRDLSDSLRCLAWEERETVKRQVV